MYARYDPYAHAEHLGLAVIRRPLPAGQLGLALPGRIILHPAQSPAQARSTCGHEIAHHEAYDVRNPIPAGTPDGLRIARRREARCDYIAARRLICLDELGDLLALGANETQMAAALDVDRATVVCRIDTLNGFEREFLDCRLRASQLTA